MASSQKIVIDRAQTHLAHRYHTDRVKNIHTLRTSSHNNIHDVVTSINSGLHVKCHHSEWMAVVWLVTFTIHDHITGTNTITLAEPLHEQLQ